MTGSASTDSHQPSVLIDLSNLASGGALQVAASFLDETAALAESGATLERWPWLIDAQFDVSKPVCENTTRDLSRLNIRVASVGPLGQLLRHRGSQFDVSFMLFGPDYGARRSRTQIVGFADGTSLTPELVPPTSARHRAKAGLRRWVSRSRFRDADVVVVEAQHVAERLVERWNIDRRRIQVVPNVLNAVFASQHADSIPQLTSARVTPTSESITLCYPARAYPHKNIQVLGRAGELLRDRHGLTLDLVLTLTDAEFGGLDPSTRAVSRTVGPLSISQMPTLYAACDGTIFTSLNESFSITPLEAMSCSSPLIASDRPFAREVAGPAALYCDPNDPVDIADAINELASKPEDTSRRVRLGREAAERWPRATHRAERYLDLIDGQLRA